MAGSLKRLLTRQRITFSTPASGTAPSLIIAREEEVIGAREVTLLLRIHATTVVTNTVVSLKVYPVAPSQDDPTGEFVGATAYGSQTIANGLAGGLMYPIAVTDPNHEGHVGSHIRVVLEATSTANAGNVDITISIDQVLKS